MAQQRHKLAVSTEKIPETSPKSPSDKYQIVNDILNEILDAVVVRTILLYCYYYYYCFIKLK